MGRSIAAAVVLFVLLESAGRSADYPCRWVYVSHGLRREADMEAIRPWKSSAPVVGSVMVPYSF